MELFGALYGTAAMREAFGARRRVAAMLRFESALARAEARAGVIPEDAAAAIEAAAADPERIDLAAIAASADTVGYPVVALTKQLARLAGDDAGRYVHWGATTQDVLDSATVLQLRDAWALLAPDLDATIEALAALAKLHRDDTMPGRTHLQHALPITFGYACAVWLAPLLEHRRRLRDVFARSRVLQFGGAVGTLASLGARGREVALALACELDLHAADAPWHVDRSAFAEVACALGIACGSLAKIATDVILLMQTEVAEAAEPHAPGRGGSSTMPQKRNPIASEYVIAATRGVHALVPLMLQAMPGDHQRSTGPWQSEEIALPQICVLASAAFAHARTIVEGLSVDAARMRANLDETHGLIVAEAVSMALAERVGHARAHAIVESASSEAIAARRPLLDVLAVRPDVAAHVDRAQLAELLDPARYVGEAGAVVDRVLASIAAEPNGL
ncbi:MAG TPA: 3-carboxy-cis,cis-muconate cycloisomerase [Candidatus Baltobacteraceae bacterium]|nr:3-carboxy-cis,cis-muconate cycloisomerase [Candidatus Baltobacteraceae bacterium]